MFKALSHDERRAVRQEFVESFKGPFPLSALMLIGSWRLPTPAKGWRIGADATTRNGRMAPSVTNPGSLMTPGGGARPWA